MIKADITKTRADIEKEVRTKLKIRKSMRKDLLVTDFDTVIGNGLLVESIKDKLEVHKLMAYEKYRQWTGTADLKKIRLRMDNGYSWRSQFIFYVTVPESEDSFNKRVKNEVDSVMKRIHTKRREIKQAEKDLKDKKRKAAIEAIMELGDEVYDVFEEIIKKDA